MKYIEGRVVEFIRHNSNTIERGLEIGEPGRHVIIDSEMNIIINCKIHKWLNDVHKFNLERNE